MHVPPQTARRCATLTATALLALTATTATAAPVRTSSAGAVRDVATCTAQVDNPHFSNGAGSVIFKARMSCTTNGNVPEVNLRVWGTLGAVSGGSPGHPAQGPPVPAATSDQTQTVPTNGQQVTYYTPAPDATRKIIGSGTYVGSVTFQIVAPALGTVGHQQGTYVYVQR
ncbi:hypothetical protein [Streptomyces sp. GS7]|uniref:hypothetical protein n=1 Tax=Streptomyces sp. GS7 TaxID=2692234 RepID=UPI001315E0A7|nr:hypothetical protein [Streptomyces sp. GS7]QHC22206.1 hypothetical protein GR130_12965 [Streptomyces sp. GS7]